MCINLCMITYVSVCILFYYYNNYSTCMYILVIFMYSCIVQLLAKKENQKNDYLFFMAIYRHCIVIGDRFSNE